MQLGEFDNFDLPGSSYEFNLNVLFSINSCGCCTYVCYTKFISIQHNQDSQ